jgi:DNA-binding NarL/FixJ family response regulator
MTTARDPIRVLLADDHANVWAGVQHFLGCAADIQVVAEEENGEEAHGHLTYVFNKLQANCCTEAVMRVVSLGWTSQSIGEISQE